MVGKTKKKEIYSDLDLGFYAHPVTQAVTRKTNRDAVRQAVKSYLFELFTPATKQSMERSIREVISNYEPRADVIAVMVEEKPDVHALVISVAFMIINDPDPVILDVILERVR